MCRFLLVKSSEVLKPYSLLSEFAEMAKHSRTPDGDLQGDGWGISWIDSTGKWNVKTSLSPVWEERNSFERFPDTTVFCVHARSASFAAQRNDQEFNQPYINGMYSFVFNGFLKNISLPVPGKIGSEKIWNLLQGLLKKSPPERALARMKEVLLNNSSEVQALNIGLADQSGIYGLCHYSTASDYYQLHESRTPNLHLICSQTLPRYAFTKLGAL